MSFVLWVRYGQVLKSSQLRLFSEKEKTPTPPEPLEPEPKEAAVSDLSNVDYCEGDKLTLQGQRVFICVR